MEHDVERRNGHAERCCNFIPRSLFKHPLPKRLRITWIDRATRRIDTRTSSGEVSLFKQLGFTTRRRIVIGRIDFSFEVHWIVKQFPPASAQEV